MRKYFPVEKDLDGFNEFLPSDHIPVAGLPDAIREQKSAWLNTISVRAVFSAEVEDGDLVVPVVRDGTNDWYHPDTVWVPALSPDAVMQAETETDVTYQPKFYGMAYKSLNRVMLGPLVYHPTYKFRAGDILYATANGKMTTDQTEVFVGACLAPGYVLLHGTAQNIDLFKKAAELTERAETAASTSVEMTEQVVEVGEAQIRRMEELAEQLLIIGVSYNKYAVADISEQIAEDTQIALPEYEGAQMSYIVGSNTLLLSHNGTWMLPGEQYTEVGTAGLPSAVIQLNQELRPGDKLGVLILSQYTKVLLSANSGLGFQENGELYIAPVTATGTEDTRTLPDWALAIAQLEDVNAAERLLTVEQPTATGSTASRSLQERFADVVNVKDFGAKGDGVTDDTAAIQAAIDATIAAMTENGHTGAVIVFPDGAYRVTSPINLFRANSTRRDLTIAGASQYSSKIIVDFYGDASQAVFDCLGDASSRCSPTSFRDIGFAMSEEDATACPVYIDVWGWGESRIENVRFGKSDNSHLRCADAQNLRGRDVVSFYGGKAWKYKTSLQETITLDESSVTTTSSTFTASDIGRKFFLTSAENSKISGFFTIAAVESPTKVTIAETGYNMSAERLSWEPARCSMTAGSADLTANTSCFTASDLGRVVWVRGARAGRYGSSFLRGKIIQVNSASAVTLDVAASLPVTNAEFAQPVFDFYSPSSLSSGASDISLQNLHIEHYRGLGFGCENATGWRVEGKIHGETAYYAEPSSAAMWLDDFDGVCEMVLDSSCSMTGTRVVVCNNNASIFFPNLQTRHNRYECIIEQETINVIETVEGDDTTRIYSGGGSTIVNNCLVLSKSSDVGILFKDNNSTTKLFITGLISFSGTANPRNYLGKTAYFTKDDGLVVDGALKAEQLSTTGRVITYGDIVANNSALSCTSPNGTYKASVTITNNAAINLGAGTSTRFSSTGSTFAPGSDNRFNLGSSALRWNVVFASTDAINTSDAREKTSVTNPDEALMRAWGKVNFKSFQFTDAVEKKGEDARTHFGVIAQQVAEAFASEGLDVSRYALFCYDKWGDEYEDVEVVDVEAVLDEQGTEVKPAVTHTEKRLITPAGDRYGIRYSEALALECAYQRWRLSRLEEKMAGIS